MALGFHSGRSADNWSALSKLMAERSVNVALLNEVSIACLESEREKARLDGDKDPVVFSEEGTIGRDRDPRTGKPMNRTSWATAVYSPHGPKPITDARALSVGGRIPDIDFGPRRPGSWTAAQVPLEVLTGGSSAKQVTCISLYGLIEEITDASMHTSLSEISPLFSDPTHKTLLLLGGDFNTSTAWRNHESRVRDAGVLERVENYGLVDCLKLARKPGRLKNCTCVFGKKCQHTWTRRDPNNPRIPYQMDYLFASIALAKRLTKCEALPPDDWKEYSDHSPIIASFE
jgi:hypothetical protein